MGLGSSWPWLECESLYLPIVLMTPASDDHYHSSVLLLLSSLSTAEVSGKHRVIGLAVAEEAAVKPLIDGVSDLVQLELKNAG